MYLSLITYKKHTEKSFIKQKNPFIFVIKIFLSLKYLTQQKVKTQNNLHKLPMLKQQIQKLLSTQKVSSISDIICFIIQQVNTTVSREPLEQINMRLLELERSKGLDVIMIEEVKTIAEALIDQREENIREDFQRSLNQQAQHIQAIMTNLNEYTKKSSRPSLGQIDIVNLLNNNSFSNVCDQYRHTKTRQSYKQNISQSLIRDNLLNDCNKMKQKIQHQKKQINQMKFSLLEMNRNISNKITLQQSYKIISEFEEKIYKKIQSEKLEIQKLEFQLKKQLYQQVKKIKRDIYVEYDIEGIKLNGMNLATMVEKLEKKVGKQKEEVKNVAKFVKNIKNYEDKFIEEIEKQRVKFQEFQAVNYKKNEDLNGILSEINQKLTYFQKVDAINEQINEILKNNAKGQWMTSCKTKNQNIIWQKELHNTLPELFKFQAQKSQILISQPSIYNLEFNLLQAKTTHLSGIISIQPLNLESPIKQHKVTGSTSLKCLLQIDQKSLISLKLIGGENGGLSTNNKAILKISKY